MMKNPGRRQFLASVGLSLGAAKLTLQAAGATRAGAAGSPAISRPGASAQDQVSAIDFRYTPLAWQTSICFPDDPQKSLIGELGDLRVRHIFRDGAQKSPARERDLRVRYTVEFSMLGMEQNQVSEQSLEAPGIPIIHTRIDRPACYMQLTAFATNLPSEGRVDNVILEVLPRQVRAVHSVPLVRVNTGDDRTSVHSNEASAIYLDGPSPRLFCIADSPLQNGEQFGGGRTFLLKGQVASYDHPATYFLRFPQEEQGIEKLKEGLAAPDRLLAATREFWQNWKPCEGKVSWNLSGRFDEFLVASAQNILQAREVKNGKTTFQVGPTVYRGLAVVDGHFLLESARYLGWDEEAQQGLEATWARQTANGSIYGMAALEKDTGIAIFTMMRQAELSQDWSYFRKMQPQVLRAVKFLMELRSKARSEGSANGRYGLLPRGEGDGGLGGTRSEFSNTLWVLVGLKALTEAADRLGLSGFEETKEFYSDLRSALYVAARQEMRQYPTGFEYLPMLMKEDPQWSASEEWDRPRPQVGQWALSQAIYPGLLFEKNDPIVKGHIQLMQACTEEDIPAETGWLPHGGVWTYNAAFVAHVYLWAGLTEWARSTFIGFLNHASKLYCWREEQPIRGSLTAGYVGDMPHNWGSAECILYLRHMLALEDGPALRLVEGISDFELASNEAYSVTESPTRFGRVGLNLEPLDKHLGWKLSFERGKGPNPGAVTLPVTLGSHFRFTNVKGATFRVSGAAIHVQPEAASWQAVWKA